jgi:hypothetical protein
LRELKNEETGESSNTLSVASQNTVYKDGVCQTGKLSQYGSVQFVNFVVEMNLCEVFYTTCNNSMIAVYAS